MWCKRKPAVNVTVKHGYQLVMLSSLCFSLSTMCLPSRAMHAARFCHFNELVVNITSRNFSFSSIWNGLLCGKKKLLSVSQENKLCNNCIESTSFLPFCKHLIDWSAVNQPKSADIYFDCWLVVPATCLASLLA